jgi:hypothetical protein
MRWVDVEEQRPDLATSGRSLLYQFDVGLAFLSTVRPDGGPRVHPICPLIRTGGLYAFIVNSPKQRDLRRDARYALHSFPPEQNEDAFYVTGLAEERAERSLRSDLSSQFVAERAGLGVPPPRSDEIVFEFMIENVLWTQTNGHGDPEPQHTVWRPANAE